MVAYELHIHGIEVGSERARRAPGAVVPHPDGARRPARDKPTDDRFRLVATSGKWRLLTRPAGPGGPPARAPTGRARRRPAPPS